MLLNLREILEPAVKDNFAVGGFNVTESTMFKAIVEEAQYREAPPIIQVSPNEFQFSGTGTVSVFLGPPAAQQESFCTAL